MKNTAREHLRRRRMCEFLVDTRECCDELHGRIAEIRELLVEVQAQMDAGDEEHQSSTAQATDCGPLPF